MKKNKKHLISILIASFLFSGTASACSAFIVPVHSSSASNSPINNVIGVRTMYFEEGLSNPLVYGKVKDNNVSTVDTSYGKAATGAISNPAKWTNAYQFIGKGMTEGRAIEGINNAGVYVGGLYLPNITSYPLYNAELNKPALGVFDIVNYVLGTSGSVQQALDNLSKVQVVLSTIRVSETGKYLNKVFPLHFFIADKTGHTAVIEFIAGRMSVSSQSTFVMTNSPDIRFQEQNYADLVEKSQFKASNKPVQIDGMYMNGSGYLGLPGDSTPPSRFERITTMLKAVPVAYKDNQANYVADMVRDGATLIPIGFNPSPTLWATKYNLATGSYDVTNYIELAAEGRFLVTPENVSFYHHSYNVNNIDVDIAKDPEAFTHAVLTASKYPLSEDSAAKILKDAKPTSGSTPYNYQFGVSTKNPAQVKDAYVGL